jgi:hypothetical protein
MISNGDHCDYNFAQDSLLVHHSEHGTTCIRSDLCIKIGTRQSSQRIVIARKWDVV